MYTLNQQNLFHPMQTSLFKQAHNACNENSFEMSPSSIAALSSTATAAIQLNINNNLSNNNNSSHLNQSEQAATLPDNQRKPNQITSLLPSELFSNQFSNSLDLISFQSTLNQLKAQNIINNLTNYCQTFSRIRQLNENANLDATQAPSSTLKNLSFQIASFVNNHNLNNATSLNNKLTTSLSNDVNKCLKNESTTSNQTFSSINPAKRQKIIPHPIQLTVSNFNLPSSVNNDQDQPLDLSIKSASSTNSNIDHFPIDNLIPINLSRSNSPQEQVFSSQINSSINSSSNSNHLLTTVQMQNYCKKKKSWFVHQQAENAKKHSYSSSSAPCSPFSTPASSPCDQPFDLDGQTLQLNSNLISLEETKNSNQSKKRKFSESSLDLASSSTCINSSLNNKLSGQIKLQAKRRLNKTKQEPKLNQIDLDKSIHQTSNSTQPGTIVIAAKDTFTCSICNEMFAFKDRLSKHIKSKHRKTIEEVQEANSSVANNLNSMQVNSTNCNVSRSSLHSNQKNYRCPTCNVAFSRSDMLTRHSRLHSGLKPYTCNICHQVFSRSDHLATHKRTHSGEKPYKCSLCNYAACRRDMITRHMKTHLAKKQSSGVVLVMSNSNRKTFNSPTLNVPNNNTENSLKSENELSEEEHLC